MKKIAFLTPADAEFGFSLAGVYQYIAGLEEAEDGLEKIISQEDAGLIVMDERMIKAVDENKMRATEERWGGIILVLPSPVKPPAEVEDYALRLIRRAIGYHVRLSL